MPSCDDYPMRVFTVIFQWNLDDEPRSSFSPALAAGGVVEEYDTFLNYFRINWQRGSTPKRSKDPDEHGDEAHVPLHREWSS